MISVTKKEVSLFSTYIYDISGIILDDTKDYLIEGRLGPLLEEYEFSSYEELYKKAKYDSSKLIQNRIIDEISTHETFFFRDIVTYDILKDRIFTKYSSTHKSKQSLRIWSAACSTGQEIYSIAMILKESIANLPAWNIELFGTDISESSILKARLGVYNRTEITRGLEEEKISRYFSQHNNRWTINDDLRKMAKFQVYNINGPITGLGMFDIIFCRNVAIYFSSENREKLFSRIADQLLPDGYLVIGSTESLIEMNGRFEQQTFDNKAFYKLANKTDR